MKILKQDTQRMVVGERGLGAQHLGLFFALLGGGGFTALTLAREDVPFGMSVALPTIAVLGLLMAIFMNKRLTHRFDKTDDKAFVEYPARMDTKLEVKAFKISEIASLKVEQQSGLGQALLRTSGSLPAGDRMTYRALGWSYVLKSGQQIESGIYSSVTEEIEQVVEALADFLGVLIE